MSPRQYRSAEVSNKAVQRAIRFDPSLDTALVAAATDAGVSINALVGTFVAEGLSNYYASSSIMTNSVAAITPTSGSSLLASSVANYSTTLAGVRDAHQDVIAKLSGTPEEEDPHA